MQQEESATNQEHPGRIGVPAVREKRSVLPISVAVVAALLAVGSIWVATGNTIPGQSLSGSGNSLSSRAYSSLGYLQDAPAPDFSYTTFDGDTLTLSGLRGQPVVLNFWASWCPPCREEARTLERGWEAYRGKGVRFVGVDIQDSEEGARGFLKQFGVTYSNGQDKAGSIAADYGITGIPETFFITREGKISGHWLGPIPEKQLSRMIEGLLQP